MPLIKRYPNRKLYDTEAKSYITLEGVAALIRNGEDVQVIDHESGEDLTTLTLTQIIL
jgi:polyhydroxyalkanoate synthesis repressor PhaR